jgi:hypothetical protein
MGLMPLALCRALFFDMALASRKLVAKGDVRQRAMGVAASRKKCVSPFKTLKPLNFTSSIKRH